MSNYYDLFILKFDSIRFDKNLSMWESSKGAIDLCNDAVCRWYEKTIDHNKRSFKVTKVFTELGYVFTVDMNEKKWTELYSARMTDIVMATKEVEAKTAPETKEENSES